MQSNLPVSKVIGNKSAIQRCGFPDCRAACCVYGSWVSEPMIAKIKENHKLISPHLPVSAQNPKSWFNDDTDPDPFVPGGIVRSTQTIEDKEHYGGTACIFMREDYKCALQVASKAAGLHPWEFKPFYCILHPLELNDAGEISLDRTDFLVIEPASCLHNADMDIPLKELFAEELEYLSNLKK
jgi:hypothetical protein